MEIEKLINEKFPLLSDGEIYLAKYILENKESIYTLSINQLAQKSLTSKSSVLRFTQKLGFSGYTEFKNLIKWEQILSEPPITNYDIGNQIINGISNTVKYFNTLNLLPIHQAIDNSEYIYLCGTGLAQQNHAAEMQRIFLKIGKQMQILQIGMNSELYQLMIERMSEKDLLIVFSSSGNNQHLKEALSIPILKNVKILSITSNGSNWLVKHSTFSIPTQIDEASNRINNFFKSSISFNVIIDLLAFSYIEYIKSNA